MPLALFGIEDDNLNLVVNLLVLFLVVLYVALVVWTFLDARRRLDDPVLIACATACGMFPFVGPIVYSILRPPEFLDDKRERELEIRAAELRVRQLEEGSCPNCEHPVERNFLRCPSCRARIKDPCESCAKPIDPRWSICPYCEMPVRRGEPAERRPAPKRRSKQPAAKEPAQRTAARSASKPPPRETGSREPARDGSRSSGATRPGSGRATRPASSRSSAAKPRKPAPRAPADE